MLLAWGISGCDSGLFTPPRPPELTGGASAASTTTAAATAPPAVTASPRSRLIELILKQPANADRLYLAQFLRRDTGLRRCAFRLTAPEGQRPFSATELAAAVRAAVGRSTGALLVEPIDAPEVREALAEAESKGVPVVLLDRPVAGPSGTTFPYVALTGFHEGARQLVAALTEDAKKFPFPRGYAIVLLENRLKDHHSGDRLGALTAALKEAGLEFTQLTFDGTQKGAYDALVNFVKTRGVKIVLADDELGVSGAFQLLIERHLEHQREFLVGGFAAVDVRLDSIAREGSEGLVNRNTEGYARALLELALDRMERKPVPERTEVEMPFIRTPPPFTSSDAIAEPEPEKPAEAAPAAKSPEGKPPAMGTEKKD